MQLHQLTVLLIAWLYGQNSTYNAQGIVIYLRNWQIVPLYPAGQAHVNLLDDDGVHVPLFWHGEL